MSQFQIDAGGSPSGGVTSITADNAVTLTGDVIATGAGGLTTSGNLGTNTITFTQTGGSSSCVVTTYSTAGTFTWTKNVASKVVEGWVAGAGGGGQGGGVSDGANSGIPRGGNSNNYIYFKGLAAWFGATESVVVGAGGAGGAGSNVDQIGADGATGGISSFAKFTVDETRFSGGGINDSTGYTTLNGSLGSNPLNNAGSNLNYPFCGTQGGSGGWFDTGVIQDSSTGFDITQSDSVATVIIAGGAAGAGSTGAAGGAGNAPATTGYGGIFMLGTGGGGGAANSAGNGGAGGNGAKGAGGGAGGTASVGFTGGTGGTGGDGTIIIVEWL